MKNPLKVAWDDFVHLMVQRPKRLQVAALCHREGKAGKEVLLITSRDTGRWIIPKGWPIRGLNSAEAAQQEAWEEAGVAEGTVEPDPIGSYCYDKTLDTGLALPVETFVYPVAVEEMSDSFPEADERKRKWVKPEDAVEMVQEPELKSLLRTL